MPDVRLTNVPWPTGTNVGAYTRTSGTFVDSSKAPSGLAQTVAVAADRSLTFSVPAGEYYAVALLGADYRYLSFNVSSPASDEPYGATTVSPFTTLGNGTFPTANRGLFFRVMGAKLGAQAVRLTVAAQSGNICLAVYRNNGRDGRDAAPEASPVASTGAIACPAIGTQEVPLGSVVDIRKGDWLYLGADNIVCSFLRIASLQTDVQQSQAYCRARNAAFPAPALPLGDVNATFGTTYTASMLAV